MLDTPDSPEALQGTEKRNNATARVEALLNDRIGPIPVWIRAPKTGAETYTGLTRSFLYQLAAQGLIRTVSIREPGKERGCRLFHLQSILEFISRHELGAQQDAK
jgi:hypothetical protein